MALRNGQTRVSASIVGQYVHDVTGFDTATVRTGLSSSVAPSADDFGEIFLGEFAIPAGGTQELDFVSFTNAYTGQAIEGQSVLAILIEARATASGGKIKLAPGATNPLTWVFQSTTSAGVQLNVSPDRKAFLLFSDGEAFAVNNTLRNFDLSNPGTVSVTARVFILLDGVPV